MIVPWPFWVTSLAITIIKIILSGTIGAVLTFYVRCSNDPYANSIRWSRIGGLYETVTLFKNSKQHIPGRSSFIMVTMIAASISVLFVNMLLGALVSRTDNPVSSDPVGRLTGQMLSVNPLYWTGWSVNMAASASMNDTLALTLNNTRFNPNPRPQTIYIPRTYIYEVACNETGAIISDNDSRMPFSYPSAHDNCQNIFATVHGGIGVYLWHYTQATNLLVAPGTHMIVAPITFFDQYSELEPLVYGDAGRICGRTTYGGSIFVDSFPKDGITSQPRTDATRCQYGSDDSTIMSATYIKFAVNRLNDFDKVTTSIFDDSTGLLPLLQSMSIAINNGTFLNSTNHTTIVIFTKISANVDLLVCASRFINGTRDMGLLCTYLLTSMIRTRPQLWDPIITTDLKKNTSLFVDADSLVNGNDLSIFHSPLRSRNSSLTTVSAAHLIKATTDATEYLASLGHNVVMSMEDEQIYVLFDTVELRDAFKVSLPLLIVLGVVMLVCIVVWGLSEILYKPVFNGSLYKVIYEEIKSKKKVRSKEEIGPDEEIKPDEETCPNEETKPTKEIKLDEEIKPNEKTKTPMLMDCTHEPLAFEGYQVIPDLDEPSGRSSQEYPMAVLDNGSKEQAPTPQVSILQLPNQQSPMLQNIPTQSPLLPPGSLVVHTPTMTPTSPVSLASPAAATVSSYNNEPTSLPSQPFIPISSPPIPPRPFANSGILTRASSTQVPPPTPPHTKISHTIQETHSSASPPPPVHDPPIESSTLIHNPF